MQGGGQPVEKINRVMFRAEPVAQAAGLGGSNPVSSDRGKQGDLRHARGNGLQFALNASKALPPFFKIVSNSKQKRFFQRQNACQSSPGVQARSLPHKHGWHDAPGLPQFRKGDLYRAQGGHCMKLFARSRACCHCFAYVCTQKRLHNTRALIYGLAENIFLLVQAGGHARAGSLAGQKEEHRGPGFGCRATYGARAV